MLWSKEGKDLTLIDWDEAMIASTEWDMARFFISHSVYSGLESAHDFLLVCKNSFCIDYELLLFYMTIAD